MPETPSVTEEICPTCRIPIPELAPAGLCPACLLQAAFEDFADSNLDECFPEIPGETLNDVASSFRTAIAEIEEGVSFAPVQSPSKSGRSIEQAIEIRRFGEYELLEEIARGGMGVVYRARQIRLNRSVALKMIRMGKFSSPAEILRLRSEAETAAQLDHPGIVPVFEIGEMDGLHYFTMAFVEGKPLSVRLTEGPLSAAEAARILQTVAIAVQYAHDQGVVHRDLKPSNILIDATGQPRVSDFGLAKRLELDSAVTASGDVLGTPSFMPPEQACGEAHQIGPAADIYSLGAVLYTCLTGTPPFHAANSVDTVRQVIELAPVPPRQQNPAIPRDLETICLKCLEKKPAWRYQSAQEFADDLQKFQEGIPITARPISWIERLWRWGWRKPELAISLVAFLMVFGVGIGMMILLQRQHARLESQTRLEGLLKQIETTEFQELPHLIHSLNDFGDMPRVTDELDSRLDSSISPEAHLRLELTNGFLRERWTSAEFLKWLDLPLENILTIGRLIQSKPGQFELIFKNLDFESGIENEKTSRQLRAVCLLGKVPTSVGDSGRLNWSKLSEVLLQEVYKNPVEFKPAQELLRPLAREICPALRERILDEKTPLPQRDLAISMLVELLHNSPREMADLICLVDGGTAQLVSRHVEVTGQKLVDPLLEILNRPTPQFQESGEGLPDEARISLASKITQAAAEDARRRAMAAAWLFGLGHQEVVWPLLRRSPDASVRYAIPDRLKAAGADSRPFIVRAYGFFPTTPVEKWDQEEIKSRPVWTDAETVSELQMILQILGELQDRGLEAAEKERCVRLLTFLFRHHPDPGIHSICEWSLNRWVSDEAFKAERENLAEIPLSDERGWYVTPQGMTLAVIRGPITYVAGSDWTDPDRLANRVVDPVTAKVTTTDQEPRLTFSIPRDFAIGTKEVSLREFLLFSSSFHEVINQAKSTTVDHPANRVNWYLGAEYCNWLSRQGGLLESEWCYVPNSEGRYAAGMTLAENYLERTGYRMPTEAEWEYACRAGTTTPRFFGHCRELIPQYAWYRDNSKERALIVSGTLKPNDFGLFDMFGNVIEWCIDPYAGRPVQQGEMVVDRERGLSVDPEAWRVLRGGHLYAEENNLRASDLWTFRPTLTDGHFGLRLARTLRTHSLPVAGEVKTP